MRSGYFLQNGKIEGFLAKTLDMRRKPLKPEDFRGFGAASQI